MPKNVKICALISISKMLLIEVLQYSLKYFRDIIFSKITEIFVQVDFELQLSY